MSYYKIDKKRDGQGWKPDGEIYAENYQEACKIFAENMTKDNWEKSNDIVWLDEDETGLPTGWYDMNGSIIVQNEDCSIDYEKSELEVFCLESEIEAGFDTWQEDVYQWRLIK